MIEPGRRARGLA